MEKAIRQPLKPMPRSYNPKVGLINFVNSLPIVLPIEQELSQVWQDLAAEFHYGAPAQLNDLYAQEALDVGAMSAFFYLNNPNLKLLSTVVIASNGPVGSVLFFWKAHFKRTNRPRLAMPKDSATSVNLLRILLCEENPQIDPEFFYLDRPNLDDFDGALVIGDWALLVDEDWSRRYERLDLGSWWKQHCGLPMVFGVWAARNDWLLAHPTDFVLMSSGFREALEIGLDSAWPAVLQEAKDRTQLSSQRLEQYFLSELQFRFSEEHQLGLEKYAELCKKHGLLKLIAAFP